MHRPTISITFLGTGTSTGIPAIGCRCHACTSYDPHDKRLRTSAIVRVGDVNILIDCGPDFRQQILGQNSPALTAAIITHSHYDHVGGIDDLRPYSYANGFDIYCREDVDKVIRSNVPYSYVDNRYPGAPVLRNHVVRELVPFEIGGVEIIPLPVMHGKLPILGYRIGPLAYITDASWLPPVTIEMLKGLDVLVINALRHEPHDAHMHLEQTLRVIASTRPKRSYLIHMSHDMGREAEASRLLPPNVTFAHDGETITVVS